MELKKQKKTKNNFGNKNKKTKNNFGIKLLMDLNIVKKILAANDIKEVHRIVMDGIAGSGKSLTLFKLIEEHNLDVWDYIKYIDPRSPHKLRKLLFKSENIDWNYKDSQNRGLLFYVTTVEEMNACIDNGVQYDYPGFNIVEYYIGSKLVSLALLSSFMEKVGNKLKHVSMKTLEGLLYASNPKLEYITEKWKKLVVDPSRLLYHLIGKDVTKHRVISKVIAKYPSIMQYPRFSYLERSMFRSVGLLWVYNCSNTIKSIIRANYILLFVNRSVLCSRLLSLLGSSNGNRIFTWITRIRNVPTLRTLCIATAYQHQHQKKIKIPSWYPRLLYAKRDGQYLLRDLKPDHPFVLENNITHDQVIDGVVRKQRVTDVGMTRHEVDTWVLKNN